MLALDIGGANIKASDGWNRSVSVPFPLWRNPDGLTDALLRIMDQFPPCARLALTMTGELADCYATKGKGVAAIVDATVRAASGREVLVWQTSGEFVSPDLARENPLLTAAANWHALATWVGRSAPHGGAILVDIGSTTTDIIPLEGGTPLPVGRTDRERLTSGELVYSGVRRTPLCAVTAAVPFRDEECPLAAELFATLQDVYQWLGDLPDEPGDVSTANGGPATREAARDRLARAICCDRTEATDADLTLISQALADAQLGRIGTALDRVAARLSRPLELVILSGEGEFVARRLLAARPGFTTKSLSLNASLGEDHSHAACAYALARLLRES